jgi:hypothetical protein
MRILDACLIVGVLAFHGVGAEAQETKPQPAVPDGKLEAVLSVLSPMHESASRSSIFLAVRNSTANNVIFDLPDSSLFIDGIENLEWKRSMVPPPKIHTPGVYPAFSVYNAPKTLKPSEEYESSYLMSGFAPKVGSHRIFLKGKNFQTPEVTFQVWPPLPEKQDKDSELIRVIREKLPEGWEVRASAMFPRDIDVVRLAPTFINEPELPFAPLIDPSKIERKPSHFIFSLHTQYSFMPPDEYRHHKAANENISGQMKALAQGLEWGRGGPTGRSDEEKERVVLYHQLEKAKYDLPDYYFQDTTFSLPWSWTAGKYQYVADKAVRAECRNVVESVLALLTPYEVKTDELKRAYTARE